MRAVIVAAMLVLMAGTARAENPDITPAEMRQMCNGDEASQGECVAYMVAVTNMLKDLIGAYHLKLGFCVPEGTWTPDATQESFLKWSDSHPENDSKMGSAAGIVLALREAYPCK
jgi:hypothetical protein